MSTRGGQSNSTADRAYVFHAADISSIFGIHYDPPSLPEGISELRARRNLWVLLGVSPNAKY